MKQKLNHTVKPRARSIQPTFKPVRPGKEDHLKRWTCFFETFPVGPNRSIEFWTEISGTFGLMDRAQRLRNERRNSILMTRHYPDLGSASDWSCRVGNLIQPIRSTTQIWVVTRHQYGISVLVSQTSFGRETSGSIANCRLFSQARGHRKCIY